MEYHVKPNGYIFSRFLANSKILEMRLICLSTALLKIFSRQMDKWRMIITCIQFFDHVFRISMWQLQNRCIEQVCIWGEILISVSSEISISFFDSCYSNLQIPAFPNSIESWNMRIFKCFLELEINSRWDLKTGVLLKIFT